MDAATEQGVELVGAVSEYLWSAKQWRPVEGQRVLKEPSARVSAVMGFAEPFDSGELGRLIQQAVLRVTSQPALRKSFYAKEELTEDRIYRFAQVLWFLEPLAGRPEIERPANADSGVLPAAVVAAIPLKWSQRGNAPHSSGRTDHTSTHGWVGTSAGALRNTLLKLSGFVAQSMVETAPATAAVVAPDERAPHAPTGSAPTPVQRDAGLGRPRHLQQLREWHTHGAEMVLGDVLMDASILEFDGVALENIVVHNVGELDDVVDVPEAVIAARRAIPEPVPNRSKAHLVNWQPPIEDQGNVVVLELAKSDYRTTLATNAALPSLQLALTSGATDLDALPRRLDVHLVVVCDQGRSLLLTRRGRHVDNEPETWMVTVGESIDWDDDSVDGAPSIRSTARRCLTDRDELNLPRALVESARFTLLALATEWNGLLANLIVFAEIPDLSTETAQSVFRKGENLALASIEFSDANSRHLIEAGEYSATPAGRSNRISDISRVALHAVAHHVSKRGG